MGLAEKRLAKQIQEQDVPNFQYKIKNLTGFEPELDILWDTFTAYDEYPLTRLQNTILPELVVKLKQERPVVKRELTKYHFAGIGRGISKHLSG